MERRLIISPTVSLIPKKNRRAARGGSARTNALAEAFALALNNQTQENSKQRKRRRNKSSVPRGGQLNLHSGQPSNQVGTSFFQCLPGTTPGGVRVRGREMIGTVESNQYGTFNLATYRLHPVAIPRLSAYVPIYEMYLFHSAKVIVQSCQPTTTKGVVAICVDYDPKDAAPANLTAMMRNISSSMANVYADTAALVDRRLSRLPKYVLEQGTDVDDAQVDQAKVYVAVDGTLPNGGGTNYPVGYAFIEYDVEFFTPQ